jgi:hypothetical protein
MKDTDFKMDSRKIENTQYKKLIVDLLNQIDSVAILKRIYLFVTMTKKD